MRFLLIVLTCFLAIPLVAEPLNKKEIDTSQMNSLGTQKFDMRSLGGGDFSPKTNSLGKKMFIDKKSSLFIGKKAQGFDKKLPLKNAAFDKEFKTSTFKGFEQDTKFFSAQKRFDTTKISPYSTKMMSAEGDKMSSMDGKQYAGEETVLIRKHLDEMQQKQYDKLDLDDVALSVEQIREMLNKE